jgi:arsenite methyltransferase
MASISEWLQSKAFGQPDGLLGRLGGWLMARGNGPAELYLVELAQLHPKDRVLILGPGPGVGLQAAGERAAIVVGVDPSGTMLISARHHCPELVREGKVQLVRGEAEDTHQPDRSADVALAVNNLYLWRDRKAALAEILRVLRPAGRLFLCVPEKRLPGGQAALARDVEQAGFTDVQPSTWEPPARSVVAVLSARRGLD